MKSEARKIAESNGLQPEKIEEIDTYGPVKRRNYRLEEGDNEYFLSLYEETSLRKTRTEATIYTLIRENTPNKSPETIDYGKNFILVEGIEGENYSEKFEDSDREDRLQIIDEHAEALAQIHGIPVKEVQEEVTGVGEFTENGFREYDNWKSYLQQRIDDYRQRSELEVEKEAVNWLENNIDRIEGLDEVSVVHDDFHIWNTLTGDKIGILDAEQGFFGDKLYDIVKTTTRWTDHYNLTEEFIEKYEEHGELPDDYEERIDFYKVESELRSNIKAREGIEEGREDLEKFYDEGEKLEQLLARD